MTSCLIFLHLTTSVRHFTACICMGTVRVRVTLRLAVYRQSVLTTSPLRLTTRFFFQLNTCCHSPYVTSSLTRGRVYRLQLLLVLAIAVNLRFESRGTHDHILLSQIRESPNQEGQVPVFISFRNRVPQLCPQALRRLLQLAGLRWRYSTPPPHRMPGH
jgi:hypothetical protein